MKNLYTLPEVKHLIRLIFEDKDDDKKSNIIPFRRKPANDNENKRSIENRIENNNELIRHHDEMSAHHDDKAQLYDHMSEIAHNLGAHELSDMYNEIHADHDSASHVHGSTSFVLHHHYHPDREREEFGYTGKESSKEADELSEQAHKTEHEHLNNIENHPDFKHLKHTHRRIMAMAKEHFKQDDKEQEEREHREADRKRTIEHHHNMEREHAAKQEKYMRMRKLAGKLHMFNLHRIYTKLANRHNRAANYHKLAKEMHIQGDNAPSSALKAFGITRHQATQQANDISKRTLKHEKRQMKELNDDPENQHPHRRIMQMAEDDMKSGKN